LSEKIAIINRKHLRISLIGPLKREGERQTENKKGGKKKKALAIFMNASEDNLSSTQIFRLSERERLPIIYQVSETPHSSQSPENNDISIPYKLHLMALSYLVVYLHT
jgi:hypothetical protein